MGNLLTSTCPDFLHCLCSLNRTASSRHEYAAPEGSIFDVVCSLVYSTSRPLKAVDPKFLQELFPQYPRDPKICLLFTFYDGCEPREVSRWIRAAIFIQINTSRPQNLYSESQEKNMNNSTETTGTRGCLQAIRKHGANKLTFFFFLVQACLSATKKNSS